jgi:four helix bundle protein
VRQAGNTAFMNYVQYSDALAYRTAFDLSNEIWEVVLHWDFFARKTIGGQLVESVDSISANLAEGFGRFHKADKVKFYHYALGSVMETKDWIQKSHHRRLIQIEQFMIFKDKLDRLPREIRTLIKITNEKLSI